jgi:LysM domain
MKINTLLTERAIIQEQILADSTYREFHALGKMLVLEYAMNQKQIQDVFQQVAAGAEAGMNKATDDDTVVSNRTMLGKGADAASYVADKYNGLKQYIGKTGPVKGLDAMIDNLQQQVTAKFGGEAGKLSQSIEFYRELSKIPGMAMAVKFIIVSTAGLLTGGVGAVAAAAGLTAANKMLQGDKFSSAVMSSLETAGTVAAIQTAKDLLSTTHVGADYGNADDQSFGPIDKSNPDPLAGIDPNNIYRPTPDPLDANSNNTWDNEPAPYSDAANAAYNQNPDPSTGLPLDPNSTRADYTTPDTAPDDVGGPEEYKVTAADGKLGVGGIAQKYPGVSAQDIIDYNNLSPDGLIKPGQVLQIPEPNVVSPASTNVWDRYEGPTNSMSQSQADALSDRAGNLQRMQQLTNPAAGPEVIPTRPFSTRPMNAGYENPKSMMREYIDIDTTARMWILRESLGKPRGGIYLSEAGVQTIFKEVARRSVVNEGPALDKLRGFNQQANAAIGRVTAPIKQAAAAGWDSATNKITYPDLEMNWRRSAKLDKEDSVDSERVIDFLHDQGVKDLLIQAAFGKIGLKAVASAGAPGVAGSTGDVGAGFFQGLGPEFAKSAEAWKKYSSANKGGRAGRTKFSVTGPEAQAQGANEPAAADATAQTPQTTRQTAQAQAEPTTTNTNAVSMPAAATSAAPVTTTAKLPTATSATAGQPSKVSYDPKMFAKKAAAPNFNALSTAASKGYKTAQPTAAPTTATTPADATATAKTRTGGKVAGQVSQTPNAIRKRAARADTTTTPSAFGNMASQLAARPTTSSTGGTTKGVAGVGNGVVSHTASPNNPNLQPATTADTKTTAPQTANPFAGLGQQSAPTFTGRQPKKAKVAEPVAETRVDFGAMLFDRMKKQS